MIISHKHKYIFIGLPYSASSAISKELIEQYEGEALFDKHANIPLLVKVRPEINLKDYYVFIVVRNPEEITFSMYNKFLTNPYNVYTDPKYFIENGGFVTKKIRNSYKVFRSKNWSFEDFLKTKYRIFPYDNNLSINRKYLNGIIRFENLEEDFEKILLEMGTVSKRKLPIYNKTRKVSQRTELCPELAKKVFGPFLNYNAGLYSKTEKITLSQKIQFEIFQKLRSRKVFMYDLRQMNNTFSIEDLKNER